LSLGKTIEEQKQKQDPNAVFAEKCAKRFEEFL